jgi:hypothetical protein
MEQHTIILETPRREIPNEGIKLFVLALINRGLTRLEYFGDSIDNQADFINEEMQRKIETTTFIEINFESQDGLDYDSYNIDQVFTMILYYLDNSENIEIVANIKDITLNLS